MSKVGEGATHMQLPQVSDHLAELKGKKVIVRANFDVPINNSQVQDTTRIEDVLETTRALLHANASVIFLAHQDRPDGQPDPASSLEPIVPILSSLLNQPVAFVSYQDDFHGLTIPPDAKLSLLENLRYYAQEEANESDFANFLATLGDAYVNEAFANCHRQHTSMVGLPLLLPSYAGYHLTKEITAMDKVLNHPEHPLIVLIGGAKLETKEPLVERFASVADAILVGGKIVSDLAAKTPKLATNIHLAQLVPDGKDITPESAQAFASLINSAATVIWNGTMGVFEDPLYQQGTAIVAQAVNSTNAFTLVGGGDTETALTQLNLESGIDHISTGGGAMLSYLVSGSLPALTALINKG